MVSPLLIHFHRHYNTLPPHLLVKKYSHGILVLLYTDEGSHIYWEKLH